MENHAQSFDVCIVCALPEEARAFLDVVRQQYEGAIEERSSPRYHYSYRFATIKNDKDETLNLHVSWLPRYGPPEMTLHLSHVLEECQPRIAIMTGICAGDAQRVHLGDLVVAERTFTYDNGKFTLDEHGRSVHLHDTMTYQLDANILQFLRLFDDWKPLVARLKRSPYPLEQRKRRKIACHIKAMASGSAVRADHPFKDVQAPVRGAVAIDMEGAAFGLIMSRHPLIPWLVVKGVCDYADQDKNNTYHDYAACASSLYALSFIRAYVTNERLPRPDGPSPSSGAGPSGVWKVPHARNPHFTGKKELEVEPEVAQMAQLTAAPVIAVQRGWKAWEATFDDVSVRYVRTNPSEDYVYVATGTNKKEPGTFWYTSLPDIGYFCKKLVELYGRQDAVSSSEWVVKEIFPFLN
jgi:nucleoside phosphorylase